MILYTLGAEASGVDMVADGGGRADKVTSTVTRSLAHVEFNEIERLALLGGKAINGTGTGLDNIITGNGVRNVLKGGSGDDTVIGGAGKDTLIGGPGDDVFAVTATGHSGKDDAADVIRGFDDQGNDRIDLSDLLGPALVWRGGKVFSAAGQIRVEADGGDVIVQVNAGGTLAADMEIRLLATTVGSMAKGDFIL